MFRTLVLALIVTGFVAAVTPTSASLDATTVTPLAAGSGQHFTLNLIGKESIGAGTGGPGGHKIFVPLYGDCRIDLSEGDFAVGDADCVNDPRAAFTLPNPDPEDDGVSSYRIYIKALGKPGGNATMTTCKEDDGTWCSTENVYVARAAGHSPSYDVSRTLLTVCHDQDGDGDYEREQIFDDSNAGYFWNYQNSGLRLAQLRFYPNTPTDISGPCPAV